jgi:hypothetical protein
MPTREEQPDKPIEPPSGETPPQVPKELGGN